MHPEVPTGLLNSPRDLFIRNQNVMSLASWVSFHLLKPVHPTNDPIWQVMPWREDVAFWDEQGKTAFLDDPRDYDLNISDESTDPCDPELPLLLKAYQAMASGGLSTAARYHFFELATNPRMGDADCILSALSNVLRSTQRCVQGRLTRAFQFGQYVIGPLGVIEKVEHENAYDTLSDDNALPGTLHEYSVIIQNCEHSSIGIFEAPLFDLETIGWSAEWSNWFQNLDIVTPHASNRNKQVVAMLGFRQHWHPDSSDAGITSRAGLSRQKIIAALQSASRKELRSALCRLLDLEKVRILESAFWLNAPAARQALEEGNLDGLDRAAIQQLLLLMDQRVLATHFNVEVNRDEGR